MLITLDITRTHIIIQLRDVAQLMKNTHKHADNNLRHLLI